MQINAWAFTRKEAIESFNFRTQQFRQFPRFGGFKTGVLRNGPNRAHRRTHCKNVAVTIGDPAARGGHRQGAGITLLTLRLQHVVVKALQPRSARDQRQRPKQNQAQHQPRTPAFKAALEQGVMVEGHQATDRHNPSPTTTMRPEDGSARPMRSRAMPSMRASAPCVLCSSWSCPHSTSNWCARACSRSNSVYSLRAWC